MTTETQERDPQYDAMMQQFMGDATRVDGDPGAVPVFTQGEGEIKEVEAATRVADTAGSAWVWHTQTYKAVPVNLNMLPDQLRKKDEDGKLLFTVYGPEDDRSPIKGLYPVKGIQKCLLHPGSEQRTYYNTLGLPVCPKSTIASPFEVTVHMEVKHPRSWAGIEQRREQAEKADDRKFQRELLGMAATGNAPVAPASDAPQNGPLIIPSKDVPLPEAGYVPEARRHGPKGKKKRKQQVGTCETCNLQLEAGSTVALRSRMTKHMKEEHPDG